MKRNLHLKHCLLLLFGISIQFSLSAQTQPPASVDSFNIDSLYHYWIKFPADTQTTCLGKIDIPGLEFDEMGCDLLAIGSSDDYFTAAADSSCYKIFRTYRIINWCEYRGQAAPITVGRDWDAWNGTNPGRCNLPQPRGNNRPGDSDLYVHIKRDFNDMEPDTVWYDADEDPYNDFPDNPLTDTITESFWWRVTSGSANRNTEDYYEGGCSTWAFDLDQNDSDISGNIASDDSDLRYGSFGYWLYTQHISVFDDAAPSVEVSGPDTFYTEDFTSCDANVIIPITVSDSCSSNTPTVEMTIDIGNDGIMDGEVAVLWNGSSFSTRYPIGDYKLIIRAYDECGNTTTIEKAFSVVDGIAPAPICYDNLIAVLSNSGLDTVPPMATIWASDFVASNVFDCSGQSDSLINQSSSKLITEFSINRVGDTPMQDQKSIQLFCGDKDSINLKVEVHAWDELGNHDFCRTEIEIQDNICTAPVMISGFIQTPDGQAFPNVDINISGGLQFMARTNTEGKYSIPILPYLRQVAIQPGIETAPGVGISTADLIRIQKHIIGQTPFDSPYQLLAADLDNNGRVNFIDLIRIRKTILGLEDMTSYNKNWLFIPFSYDFQNPMAPWDETFPERIIVDGNMNFNSFQGNFWAIKIGDTNGSAVNEVETRSNQSAQLLIPDLQLMAGQTYEVPIYLKDLKELQGCQFALTWNADLVEILSAETPSSDSEFNLSTSNGNSLKAVWLKTTAINRDGFIGSIRLRAKSNSTLSQTINITDRYLTAEAYNSAFETRPLELGFQATNIAWNILENPFRTTSSIQFSDPISGPFQVYDQNGRMVWSTNLRSVRSVEIRKQNLGAAGIYYFKMSYRGEVLSGKLVCLD